jgi:hypothetical protein
MYTWGNLQQRETKASLRRIWYAYQIVPDPDPFAETGSFPIPARRSARNRGVEHRRSSYTGPDGCLLAAGVNVAQPAQPPASVLVNRPAAYYGHRDLSGNDLPPGSVYVGYLRTGRHRQQSNPTEHAIIRRRLSNPAFDFLLCEDGRLCCRPRLRLDLLLLRRRQLTFRQLRCTAELNVRYRTVHGTIPSNVFTRRDGADQSRDREA